MLVTLRGQRVKLKGTWEIFGKDDEKSDHVILDQLVESILKRNAVNGKKKNSNNLGKGQQQSQVLTSSCLYPD